MVISVAVVVGSLRRESFSRKVAKAAMARSPSGMTCELVEISDIPMFNEDLEVRPPAEWETFRSVIRRSDGVLFVTPEYNRSVPGCLKNAIDVGSRPEGENVWDGKSAGVISVTPYKLGAFGANHALRQTFVFLNMPVMQQPEAYIGGAGNLFDEKGTLTDDETGAFLKKFMDAFSQWTGRLRSRGG